MGDPPYPHSTARLVTGIARSTGMMEMSACSMQIKSTFLDNVNAGGVSVGGNRQT